MNNLDLNNNNNNLNENKQDNQNLNHHHRFQVKNTPKGLFPLFKNTSDSYVYEKKFYCDLPTNIIPPKIFHYPFSLENFCKTDLLTMNFDLKKNNEIITDPKLNTLIHQDFINNSLELIFPNLTTISKEKTEKEEKLKKEILEIIERKEEMPIEKKKVLLEKPYYLRESTFITPSLTVTSDNKRNPMIKKPNIENRKKIDIKEEIKNSFKDIEKIKSGIEHPLKKGVTIKEVYNILPMDIYPSSKYYQYIFPIDPNKEINISEKIEIPDRFILRKNENEKEESFDNYFEPDNQIIYSLYKNEKLKEKKENNENQNYAEYFSHEKDYIITNSNEYELFNRYLMFLDKKEHILKLAPITDKITLKKHKKSKKDNNDLDDEGNDNYYLNQKRERDIIVIPKEIEEQDLKKIKKWYKDYGLNVEFKERKIENIDYNEIKEVQKEKEEEKERQREKEEERQREKEERERLRDEENEEKSSYEEKNYQEENGENDDSEDFFADKGDENNEDNINKSPLNKSENNSVDKNNDEDDALFDDDNEENEKKIKDNKVIEDD
jgi:hypothetical protein